MMESGNPSQHRTRSGHPVDNAPPRQPRPQADKHDVIPGLEHALLHHFIQGDGDRGAGGVAVFLDVVVDFLFGFRTILFCFKVFLIFSRDFLD